MQSWVSVWCRQSLTLWFSLLADLNPHHDKQRKGQSVWSYATPQTPMSHTKLIFLLHLRLVKSAAKSSSQAGLRMSSHQNLSETSFSKDFYSLTFVIMQPRVQEGVGLDDGLIDRWTFFILECLLKTEHGGGHSSNKHSSNLVVLVPAQWLILRKKKVEIKICCQSFTILDQFNSNEATRFSLPSATFSYMVLCDSLT